MCKRKIYSLGLEVNEVVYLRRDGKVVGAKYLGLESNFKVGEITTLRFYRADGIYESIKVCCGYLKESSKNVYATIEDAIHQIPIEYEVLDITDLMKQIFGFTHMTTGLGRNTLGKTMWTWDGFRPKMGHVWHANYKIIYNGDWVCECLVNKKYYDTEEECRANNHVDVVTF
jgi:hypothetical protein